MTEVVDMLDAIGANLGAIPKGTKKVATYLTGSGGIEATSGDLERLRADDPQLELLLRIDQANQSTNIFHQVKYLVIDIEPGAANVPDAVRITQGRNALGLKTCWYYFLAEEGAVKAAGDPLGVDYWLAHWGIGRDAAVALLGGRMKAVQYENGQPGQPYDRSVTLADWPNAPAPPPAPKRSQALLTVTEHGKGGVWGIRGADNPGDENIPNAEDWHVHVVKHGNGTWDASPMAATKPKRPALSIHPKVAAVAGVAGVLTAVRGALAAFGVHVPLTDTEQAAIVAALPVIAGYLKSSGVEVTL